MAASAAYKVLWESSNRRECHRRLLGCWQLNWRKHLWQRVGEAYAKLWAVKKQVVLKESCVVGCVWGGGVSDHGWGWKDGRSLIMRCCMPWSGVRLILEGEWGRSHWRTLNKSETTVCGRHMKERERLEARAQLGFICQPEWEMISIPHNSFVR